MTDPTPNRPSDLIGQRIGNYIIEELLGTGGMGQVFRARHALLDRLVAFKLMHGNLAKDPQFQARFRQEAKSAAALRHPHIVEVFDFDEQDGFAYLVMELITKGSLTRLLRGGTQVDPSWSLGRGLELVRQAADALAYADALGMVHRDIKPDNLLLQQSGPEAPVILKVGDFGLARIGEGSGLTAANTAMGTPAYMSPEQCQGRELDGRSDVYALGVVLFEIATGSLPFPVRTMSEAVFKHVYAQPPAPRSIRADVPEALEGLILRCLAKTAPDRPTAAELAALLRDLAGTTEGAAASMIYSSGVVGTTGAATGIGALNQAPPDVSSLVGRSTLPQIQVLDEAGTLLQVKAVPTSGLSVGRLPTNDIALEAQNVSRNHLRIEWDGQRTMVLDLGSRSGTQLGDVMLPAQELREWPYGTLLRVGSYWLRLDPPASASQPPTSSSSMIMNSFVSAGQLSVSIDQELLSIVPGQMAAVEVVISNMGTAPDQVVVDVEGFPDDWVTLPPPVQIAPNGQVTARLTVTVPEDSAARAGEYPVEVRARSRTTGAAQGTLLARWTVQPYSRASLSLSPARLESRGAARTRVAIRNEGNAPVVYRLAAADDSGNAVTTFADEHVTVEPGDEATVELRIERPVRLFGEAQQSTIEVQAHPQRGPAQSAPLQFRHQALLPTWSPIAGVGLLALVVALFFASGAFGRGDGDDTVGGTATALVAVAATGEAASATALSNPVATSASTLLPTDPAVPPTATPAPGETTLPASPEVGQTPEAGTTPGAAQTPEAGTTPGAAQTPEAGTTPGAAQTPEAGTTPGAAQTPEATQSGPNIPATRTAQVEQQRGTQTAIVLAGIEQQTAISLTQTAEAPTVTPTSMPSSTPTNTPQNTPTSPATNTPTLTSTPTSTSTPTNTPTPTDTPTPTLLPGFSIGDYVGNWTNVDTATGGMTRLVITQVDANNVRFDGYGSCSPTDCDWTQMVGGSSPIAPFTPPQLTANYNFGFKTTEIIVLYDGPFLQVTTIDRYSSGGELVSNYTMQR